MNSKTSSQAGTSPQTRELLRKLSAGLSREELDAADVYMGIIGSEYGTVVPDGLSARHREYKRTAGGPVDPQLSATAPAGIRNRTVAPVSCATPSPRVVRVLRRRG